MPFEQRAHPVNHFPRAPCILSDVAQDGTQLAEVRWIFPEQDFCRFRVAMDRAKGLVQFVR